MAASLFRTVARFEGLAAAWMAVLLLACSSLYLELSVAVLIGLPAVALAMLSPIRRSPYVALCTM